MESRNILQEIKDFKFKEKYLELGKIEDKNRKWKERKKLLREYKRRFLKSTGLSSQDYADALKETITNQIPQMKKYRSKIIMGYITKRELKHLIYKIVQKYLEGITIKEMSDEINLSPQTIDKSIKEMGKPNMLHRLVYFRKGSSRIYYTFNQLNRRFGNKMPDFFNISPDGRAERK